MSGAGRIRRAMARLPFVLTRRRQDEELADELAGHLKLLTERYERAGMAAADASAAARRQLGSLRRVRDDVYGLNSIGWLDALVRDAGYAVRTIRRGPGFSLVAILTLALGIGATTAMASVVYAVLLKPLPYAEAGDIYSAQIVIPERRAQFPSLPTSIQAFLAWRRDAPPGALAALRPWECNLTGDAEPERVGGARVSANFFQFLGVPLGAGRGFAADEENPGRDRVVVVSDALWRRRYAGDPHLVGRSIAINGQPHLVVGIAPPSLLVPTGALLHTLATFAPRVDIWRPIAPTPAELAGESWDHGVLVRVPRGTGVESTRQRLEGSLRALLRERAPGFTSQPIVELVSAREIYAAPYRLRLLLILGAAGLLLLTACVSLANLLLARGASRANEFATRVALGAGRGRLVSLALTEALVLALAGGVVAVMMAHAGVRALAAWLGSDLLVLRGTSLDLPLLLIALATSLITAVACAVVPAWRVYRADAASQLHEGVRASIGGGRTDRTRRVLVGIEMTLATALLASAALLLHSFVKVVAADRGYAVDRILTADLSLFGRAYAEGEARVAFYRQLAETLRALPGVDAAGAISDLPAVAAHTGASRTIFHPGDSDFQRLVLLRPVAMIRGVTDGYFAASGTPLRAGRVFQIAEPFEAAIVSESLAARLWPAEPVNEVIGRQFRQSTVKGPLVTVVGVAGDARPGSVDRTAPPVVYRPHAQWASGPMTLLVRTSGDPERLAAPVRAAIRAADPNLPVLALRTMEDVVGSTVAERRLQVLLTATFAAVALLLGAVGLYGVVSYAVARRTREIGLRLALGAPRLDVMRSVFAHGMPPVLAGLATGQLAAVAAATSLRSLLFGVAPLDPLSLGTVALVLMVTAGLACYLPARRAASLDPLVALRHE